MSTTAKRAPKARNWTPVHKGEEYCSPACGMGCKHADYLLANRHAKELRAKLGPGWHVHVWESFGWHCELSRGIASIIPMLRQPRPSYHIYINGPYQVIERGRDPIVTLKRALAKFREKAERAQRAALYIEGIKL